MDFNQTRCKNLFSEGESEHVNRSQTYPPAICYTSPWIFLHGPWL